MQKLPQTEPGGARVLGRVLDILDAFEWEAEVTVAEIASRLDKDKSTAYRQLAALARRGYLDRDPVTGRFRLGLRLLRLGMLVAARLSIRDVALPILTHLQEVTGESVGLAIRDGASRTYIEVLESAHLLRRVQPIGRSRHLLPGSPGKVFLAFMPPEEAAPIIASAGSVSLASGGTMLPSKLSAEIETVRATGVAWSMGESGAGSGGCAFPVFDRLGKVVAAINIFAPMIRFTPEQRALCAEQGRAAAAGERGRQGRRRLGGSQATVDAWKEM